MAGALEDCLVVAGGLEAVEPKRKVMSRLKYHQNVLWIWSDTKERQ